jgi:methyltransferase (TIGR00027 family)
MSESDLIQHISDTSLWIAGYRARETARPNAVFQDPFAERLAGSRGMQMVTATPHTESMAFAMVVRTTAIDRLIHAAIQRGIDTVINLGAGLDTRPYRMTLPAHLKWYEVDFPQVIDYKNEMLKAEKPVCPLQRISCDLSIQIERLELFARLDAVAKKALIITEGVVAYLTNDQAAQFSKDLYSMPHFYFWIQDYRFGKYRKTKQSEELQKIVKNTPFRFDAEDPVVFFNQHGWKMVENIFLLDEGDRIGRKMPVPFSYSLLLKIFPKKFRAILNKTYGFVLFARE